jgi:hypothetical protein
MIVAPRRFHLSHMSVMFIPLLPGCIFEILYIQEGFAQLSTISKPRYCRNVGCLRAGIEH